MIGYLIISILSASLLTCKANAIIPIHDASLDYYTHPKYDFSYSVSDPHTGDKKSQWEARDGDVVKGTYSLVEPDGSIRQVDYTADDHRGFNAVVKKLGPNIHTPGIIAPIIPIHTTPFITKPIIPMIHPISMHTPIHSSLIYPRIPTLAAHMAPPPAPAKRPIVSYFIPPHQNVIIKNLGGKNIYIKAAPIHRTLTLDRDAKRARLSKGYVKIYNTPMHTVTRSYDGWIPK